MQSLRFDTFSAPKQGHQAGEYEDAFSGDAETGRFAIADGASESSFAGEWARALVEGFVKNTGPWSRWLPPARAAWLENHKDLDLPWYAEAKLGDGAHATLLGLAFRHSEKRTIWSAASVGDSCLFVVREEKLIRSFPLRSSADFDNQPALIGSRIEPGKRTRRRRVRGVCWPGDLFFLMTDALAQWFLARTEKETQPWRELTDLQDEGAFDAWIQKMRDTQESRNDDVTMARIAI